MITPITLDLPDSIDLYIRGTRSAPALRATMMRSPDGARHYFPVSVTLQDPFIPVTSTVIKRTPLHAVLTAALRAGLLEHLGAQTLDTHPALKTYFKGSAGRKTAAQLAQDPDHQLLVQAALVYRTAQVLRDAPVRAVQRSFNLTYPQAKRWVRRIRSQPQR